MDCGTFTFNCIYNKRKIWYWDSRHYLWWFMFHFTYYSSRFTYWSLKEKFTQYFQAYVQCISIIQKEIWWNLHKIFVWGTTTATYWTNGYSYWSFPRFSQVTICGVLPPNFLILWLILLRNYYGINLSLILFLIWKRLNLMILPIVLLVS